MRGVTPADPPLVSCSGMQMLSACTFPFVAHYTRAAQIAELLPSTYTLVEEAPPRPSLPDS